MSRNLATPRFCPHCAQLIPPKLFFEGAPVKQRIYDYVAAHPEGVARTQLFDHIYADNVNGGPLHLGTISVHINRMNPVLARHGLIIRGSLGPGATFKLLPIQTSGCEQRRGVESPKVVPETIGLRE
jgi:hypothetical protein